MRLFDFHPPPNLYVGRILPQSSCSANAKKTLVRDDERLQLSARLHKWRRENRSQKLPHEECAPLGTTSRLILQAMLGKNQMHSSDQRRRFRHFFGKKVATKQRSKGRSNTKKAHIYSMRKSFGKTALFATISLQKMETMRSQAPRTFSSSWTPSQEAWWFKPQRESSCSKTIIFE